MEDDTNGDNDDSLPGPSRGRRPPPPRYKKTPAQEEGERTLSLLVSEGAGRSYSFHDAMDISSFISKNSKKQTTRFAGVLEVGPQLKIPCKIFTKVHVHILLLLLLFTSIVLLLFTILLLLLFVVYA